jgi:predicted RNA binding protein YcfA (HicA-like mRNA interferase family)
MSKADKTILKMRDNPRDWTIDSLEIIAKRLGIQVRKSGGSHVVFMHEDSDLVVTVPSRRPIKPVYIQQFLALLDDLGA